MEGLLGFHPLPPTVPRATQSSTGFGLEFHVMFPVEGEKKSTAEKQKGRGWGKINRVGERKPPELVAEVPFVKMRRVFSSVGPLQEAVAPFRVPLAS